MNKLKHYISSGLLTIYIMTVWTAFLYINNYTGKTGLLIFVACAFVASVFFADFSVKSLSGVTIKCEEKKKSKCFAVFLAFFIAAMAITLIIYLTYIPGNFSTDSRTQLEQATTGVYSDWHPVWHTLIFFTLPYKLTGNIQSIVLFQIIYFSLFMGYMGMFIYKISNIKIAILSFVYIIINPVTIVILMYPWKDVGFALAGGVAAVMSTDMFFSTREKIKWYKIVILGVFLATATLFRHNGILFTAMIVFALVFVLEKKQLAVLLASFVILFASVKGPIYHILNVEKPDSRVIETMGLPLTIIGNVAKEAPEKMDEEMLDFVYSIAPQEKWQNNYACGDFNSLKWSDVNLQPIEDAGVGKILSMTARCFRYAPAHSLRALICLTDIVYNVESNRGMIGNYDPKSGLGFSHKVKYEVMNFIDNYKTMINAPLFKSFTTVGMALLLMTISIAAKSDFTNLLHWKKILICLPIYSYNFGTMLLLTGWDLRFFYITFLVTPLVIVTMFKEGELNNGK